MKYLLLFFLTINLYGYDRIIALSPSINEIIYALNANDKIVGNTTYSTYPKKSSEKSKVGGYFSPNLEKIVALKPDLVIMLEVTKKLSTKLKKLGIETKIIKLKKLNDIKNSIKEIGKIVNKEEKANKIVQKIDIKLNEIQNIVSNKKILIVISAYGEIQKRVFVAGQNLYFDDIINISGNSNALQSKRKGQPVLNIENIIATNPDIVILLSPLREKRNLTIKEVKKTWLNLPITAAKKENIYVLDKEYAGISSDRLAYFLEDFKEYLTDVRNK